MMYFSYSFIFLSILPIIYLPIKVKRGLYFPIKVKKGFILYFYLIPIYLYCKSLYLSFSVMGHEINWPTLIKDVNLIVLILMVIVFLKADPHFGPSIRLSKFIVWALFVGLFLVIQVSLTDDFDSFYFLGAIRSYLLMPLVFLFLTNYTFTSYQEVRSINYSIVFSGTLVVLVGMFHKFVSPGFLIDPNMRIKWHGVAIYFQSFLGDRLQSFMPHPNVLAYYLSIFFLADLWLIFDSQKPIMKLAALFLLPITLLLILFTQCRSALFGLLLAALCLVVIARWERRWISLSMGLCVGALLLLILPTFERYSGIGENPRFALWSYFFSLLSESLPRSFFGMGLGRVGTYGFNNIAQTGDKSYLYHIIGTDVIYFVDNFFIRVTFELGFLGLLYSISIFGILAKSVCNAINNLHTKKERELFSLPFAILVFIVAISFFSEALITFPWNLYFWSFSFVLLRRIRFAQDFHATVRATPPNRSVI